MAYAARILSLTSIENEIRIGFDVDWIDCQLGKNSLCYRLQEENTAGGLSWLGCPKRNKNKRQIKELVKRKKKCICKRKK
jgi:hypothetical protein